jgi:hypothetical protein
MDDARHDQLSGQGKGAHHPAESDRTAADYPGEWERDKWIFEQRRAGRTIPSIIDELSRNRHHWTPLFSDNSIRAALRRYAAYCHLDVPKGSPGRRPN